MKNYSFKSFFLLTLAVLVAVMCSCNTNGEYVKRNGTICYSYWTFSFGTVFKELPGVNPTEFKSVNDWLGPRLKPPETFFEFISRKNLSRGPTQHLWRLRNIHSSTTKKTTTTWERHLVLPTPRVLK